MVNRKLHSMKMYKNPWFIILLPSLLLLSAIVGCQYLSFTTDFRAYFSTDNPQLQAFQQLESDFNKQDTLVFLIEMEDESRSVLNLNTLNFLAELTQKAWQLPFHLPPSSTLQPSWR